MSSLFDPKNPAAINHLKKLAGDLPGMVQDQIKARNRSKNGGANGFTRFCPICGLLYERSKLWSTPDLKEGNCKGCQAMLNDGYTALVTISKRWAFVKYPVETRQRFKAVSELESATSDDRAFLKKLAESEPGKIVLLTDEEMDEVAKVGKK